MADTENESPAQMQARLRRDKRNAKIQAGGNDRLAKITQVTGRAVPEADLKPPRPSVSDDPPEIDISEHHWTPESRAQQNVLQAQQNRQDPFAGMRSSPMSNNDTPPNVDPMMAMMQQMLGGGGANGTTDANGGDPMQGLPPMLQAMMRGQAQTNQDEAQAAAQPKSDTAYFWRILHAVFAFGLAIYIALTTTFNGSKLSRTQTMDDTSTSVPQFFYIFATAELALQSSRYFFEKGQLQGTGWIATIANSGMVPEPFVGYLRVAGRYMVIWQTVVADAMVIVFALGLLAWWKDMPTATLT